MGRSFFTSAGFIKDRLFRLQLKACRQTWNAEHATTSASTDAHGWSPSTDEWFAP